MLCYLIPCISSHETEFTIYNVQLTKGSQSLVRTYKIRTDIKFCTKLSKTPCELIIVNCQLFSFVVHRGVEPRFSEPKSGVIPIYEWTKPFTIWSFTI